MSGTSKIEWTDATWNPVRGCTKISPGCKHCYAETFAERFRGVGVQRLVSTGKKSPLNERVVIGAGKPWEAMKLMIDTFSN